MPPDAAAGSSPRVAVTSVIRGVGASQTSGYIRIVDLDAGRVLVRAPVPESSFRMVDPNPRGGYRGAKGLSAYGDRLVVSNSERLFVFGRDWRISAEISNSWMGSVHDVLAEEDGIWVTCTNCDVLLNVGWDGEIRTRWSWRSDARLAEQLGFVRPPQLRHDIDYRDPRSSYGLVKSTVQLNALARTPDGLLLSFGRVLSPPTVRRKQLRGLLGRAAALFGVFRYSTGGDRLPAAAEPGSTFALVLLPQDGGSAQVVFRRPDVSVPNHNVLVIGSHVLYNDTDSGHLVALAREGFAVERSILIPGSPSFARGLAQIGPHTVLVGSQAPMAVHTVDLESGSVAGSIQLSDEPRESVYAVSPVPESFADPPEKLFDG